MGEVLIYNLIKTSPLFFAGHKLHPPGIGIEATAVNMANMMFILIGWIVSVRFWRS